MPVIRDKRAGGGGGVGRVAAGNGGHCQEWQALGLHTPHAGRLQPENLSVLYILDKFSAGTQPRIQDLSRSIHYPAHTLTLQPALHQCVLYVSTKAVCCVFDTSKIRMPLPHLGYYFATIREKFRISDLAPLIDCCFIVYTEVAFCVMETDSTQLLKRCLAVL